MRRPVPTALIVALLLFSSPVKGSPKVRDSLNPTDQPPPRSEAATIATQESKKGATQEVTPADSKEPVRRAVDFTPEMFRAKTALVIGMDATDHKKCSRPPFPCAKRAREETELSLQKWGRFTQVKDPAQADVVLVAIESIHINGPEARYWAQLRVFKGPATPDFLAEMQKKLADQLRTFNGPAPLENQPELLWEGWRYGVDLAHGPPSSGGLIGSFIDLAETIKWASRLKENSKERHRLVADEFSRAVAEAEVAASAETKAKLVAQSSEPKPPEPAIALEIATLLLSRRAPEEIISTINERGLAFEVEAETLWYVEALGADESVLQALRSTRVESYFYPDSKSLERIQAEAQPVILPALRAHLESPALHFAMARALDNPQSLDAAMAEYREAVRLKPDFETAHINLGVALGRSGDLKGAINELREALRLNPSNALAHSNLGVALANQGDLNGSIAEHREAVRLRPGRVGARLNFGTALGEKGDWVGAEAEYREAVRLAPRYTEAHHGLGLTLAHQGNLPGARLEFQEALRLSPNDAGVHNDLGSVLQSQGDLKGALAEFRHAMRLQPDLPEAASNAAAASQLASQPGAAEKEARKAVQKYPNDPFSHNILGEALLEIGDVTGALIEFRESLRLKRDYPEARVNLGTTLVQKGKLDEGLAELREAVRLQPDLAHAHFHLGQTLQQKGDKTGALEAFQKAYKLAPEVAEYRSSFEALSRKE